MDRFRFDGGEHKENLDFMQQLIQFGAENLQEKIEQGLELLRAERVTEAKALFDEVLENPDADMNHFMAIGDGYLKKTMWVEAQGVFSLALERYPESLHLMNRMAISLRKGEKFKEALLIYKKALLLSPRDEGLYYNLARLFMDMSEQSRALQCLRKSLAIKPGFGPSAKLLQTIQGKTAVPGA